MRRERRPTITISLAIEISRTGFERIDPKAEDVDDDGIDHAGDGQHGENAEELEAVPVGGRVKANEARKLLSLTTRM